MTVLNVEVPNTIFTTLRRSPKEVAQEMRIAAAVEWYRLGRLSQGRAAEVAGLSRADFIDELAARKVEVVQVDLEELDRELGHG